jgi:hypothetical protein
MVVPFLVLEEKERKGRIFGYVSINSDPLPALKTIVWIP